MDKFIAIILIIVSSTTLWGEQTVIPWDGKDYNPNHKYVFISSEDKLSKSVYDCDWGDVAVGAGVATAVGSIVGYTTVATAATTAGGTVGWLGALSAPFFLASTLPTIAVGTAVFSILVGLPAYAYSCAMSK